MYDAQVEATLRGEVPAIADKPEYQRSSKWPAVRAAHLKLHPTCAACGSAAVVEVHHVLPFHWHPLLELDPTNLLTLCQRPGRDCHFCFGHAYDWHGWNPHARRDAARFLLSVKASRRLALEAREKAA